MGVVRLSLKLFFGALSVAAAVLSLSIGVHLSPLADKLDPYSVTFSPLKTADLERAVIASLNEGDASIYSSRMSQLIQRSPLSEVPFEAQMVKSALEGDVEAANLAAVSAIKRSPRSLAVRLHRLSHAASSGELNEALFEYRRLTKLQAIDEGVLADAIIGVFRQIGDWAVLIDELVANPEGGSLLFYKLFNEPIPRKELDRLFALYPEHQLGYLQRLIREGDVSHAYSNWRSLYGDAQIERLEVPFNRTFQRRSELPPFNWQVRGAHAELLDSGGMFVRYSGSEAPLIADQIMRIQPGNYVFETTLQGSMPVDGGALEWRLQCFGDHQGILELTIKLSKSGVLETFQTGGEVPASDCEFQRLSLWGVPGAFPKAAWAEMISVDLRPN